MTINTTRKRTAARLHLLTARHIQAAGEGDHSDGGGLLLRVRGESASWVFRFTAPSGRRREMGLGVSHRGSAAQAGHSLTAARDAAHRARDHLRQLLDPIEQRDGVREAGRVADKVKRAERAADHWTLCRCARDFHERVIEPTRTDKHAAQWISSLENHMPAGVWHRPIREVEPPALLEALLSIKPHERARNLTDCDRIAETVQRVRQRLDAVFEDAIFHKRCTSNAAAAVRRKLRESMPKSKKGKFSALPYKEAPAFMARLRTAAGTAARCLEFSMLTAARTGESIGAVASEFELDSSLWRVPPERMKSSGKEVAEEHLVHLPDRAKQIVEEQVKMGFPHLFPSPADTDKPLSNMAMLAVLDRLGVRERTTVHGLCRATFSTWAYETAAARGDVIEACLAHSEADKVKAAYNRAQFNRERRNLLKAWADFLAQPAAQVVALQAA